MNLETQSLKLDKYKPGLYVVSTPIGNLDDITLRAIKILQISDVILCEDTRISKKLLSKYSIVSKLISYHKFNEKKKVSEIIEILNDKKIVSIISDAGTPTISDPGVMLINECINENINIFPIPGPSAVSAAASISGFSNKYIFYGFLPEKISELKKDFNILRDLQFSIIFFVSAKKINKFIPLIKEYFYDRELVICKEMTKYFEEHLRIKISNLKPFKNLRGEITLVISDIKNKKIISNILNESDKKNINNLIKKLSVKEIVKLISNGRSISKKEIYNYCLSIKNEN